MMENIESISPTKLAAFEAIREAHQGNDAKTQCARLRAALSSFAVTTFEAMRYLDVYHAPARVMQLRNAGENIQTHWQTVITEAGVKHRVGLYVLESSAQP